VLSIDRPALDELAALLLERAGLKIQPDSYHGLRLALSSRMPALGLSDADEYVRRLKGMTGENELRSLLPLVTVGHTEFFRDSRQFAALERRILPELLLRARAENRKANIWSAGCATGEEPYSLGMLLIEMGALPREADVWATDLNVAAVDMAGQGRFSPRRMQQVSEARRKRFFRALDDGFELLPEVKDYVRFEGLNLAAPVFAKVVPGSMDLILCRNVIIYFDLPTIRGLMDRFLLALRPGGLLLLGYSESLFKVYDRFEMVDIEGSFIYRKGSPQKARRDDTPTVRIKLPVAPRPTREMPLAAPAPKLEAPPPPKPAIPPDQRLDEIIKQIDAGDFVGALSGAEKLAADETDLKALLTLGNIYAVLGRLADARTIFDRVIAREPFCVEARIFGAVAALQGSKLAEARAELSKALFLEPSLAIGHYLLAQIEERAGERESARRSYRNAIAQLRFPQRPLAGHLPDLPDAPDLIGRAARYALAALEER
jgi:chemotaxis protein methyltransferase CheR